jgi:hypothetical protein
MTPAAAIVAATPHPPGVGGIIALCLLALAVVLFYLDRLGLWMQRRGWISYRKQEPRRSGGGAMAGLMTEFQKIVEPQIEHRIQVMEERNESFGQRFGRGDDVVKKKDADVGNQQ